ncbi:Sec23-binding domain of Sec16-domain-containing protein [Pisolithus croceorrhizus]|nr:Sec23-binding domain of Sec16-domain-containing protein [Pisolithus croceorrhizus]
MTVSRPAYAPSPSLLGSNDPLGRVSARAPIVSFGFGGKLVPGFDVALSSRRTTNITIREVHQVLPEYALEPQAALYPGPLFSDPGSPVTSLVRTGMSSNLKTKKARVIKYLEERAAEMSRGATSRTKLALVQVLKVMVEHDGVLHGSPQIDSAIRAALMGIAPPLPTTNETPISVTATRPSALDKIQEFLAYHYALDEKLWAHAMVISSSIDKEAWKEVVGEFLKAELGVHDTRHTLVTRGNDSAPPRTNGRECLRVIYSLFSGQGPAASKRFPFISRIGFDVLVTVQELVPINLLSRAPASLKVPAPHLPHITPMSPNFPSAAAAAQVPSESLLRWPEIVASVLTNVSNPEWSAAITALGDYLLSHQQVEAAHVCYMLSPQTSIIGGVGSPSARIILLGSQSPHSKPTFCKDFDATIFSEIMEFAFSLKATPKGQESFLGFPHLQAYKLIRAVYLAEIGHVQAASRYCEAITASMSRPSPYFNPGAPDVDKSGSWISGKVNKPSLDSIGSWLEGRLTKFIAGEGDEPFPSATSAPSTFSGPAPYGSILWNTTDPCTVQSPAPPKTAPLQPFYPFSPYTPPMNGHATTGPSSRKSSLEESGGWWDSLSSADSSTTPVATDFRSGLVSLMDDPALSATPSSGADEEDDLGLSNSTFKKPEESAKPVKGHSPSPTPPQEPTVQTEDKSGSSPTTQAAASGSSWFSRFWKRSETPGPVKANLGEETSFYYDKELKRWVNKKVSGPTTGGPPIALPLARTASAIDLTSPKPPGVGIAPPPMGRPRSQAAKKNVRSRYVDVFQQEAGASAA